MMSLPVIDIAPLCAMEDADAIARAAEAIDAAGRAFGFFYAEGHGIEDALFDRLEAASRTYPLFYDPDFAAPVDPLPIDAETGRRPRWDGVDVHAASGTYGDYLLGRAGKIFPALAAVLGD